MQLILNEYFGSSWTITMVTEAVDENHFNTSGSPWIARHYYRPILTIFNAGAWGKLQKTISILKLRINFRQNIETTALLSVLWHIPPDGDANISVLSYSQVLSMRAEQSLRSQTILNFLHIQDFTVNFLQTRKELIKTERFTLKASILAFSSPCFILSKTKHLKKLN